MPSLASESSHDSLQSSCHHSPSNSQSFKVPRTKGSFSLPFTSGQVPRIPINEENHQRQQSRWKSPPSSYYLRENSLYTQKTSQERHECDSWRASQSECAIPEPLSFSAAPASHSSVGQSGTAATTVGLSSPESKDSTHPSLQLQHMQLRDHSQPQQLDQLQQSAQQSHKWHTADPSSLPAFSPPPISIDNVDACEDAYHEYLRSVNQSCTLEAPECSLPSPAMTTSLHGLETILPSVSEDDEGFATFSRSVRMVDLPAYNGPDCTQNLEPSYRPESQPSASTITLSNARESLVNRPPPKTLGLLSSGFHFDLPDEHRVSMNRSSMTGGLFSSWAADSDSSSDEEFEATIESARNLSTLKEEDEESVRDSQNTIFEVHPPSRPSKPDKTPPPALTLETHLLDHSNTSLEEIPTCGSDSLNDDYQQTQMNPGVSVVQQSIPIPESATRRHLPGSSSLASASESLPMSPRSAMRDPQNTSKPRRRANTTGKSVRFEDTQSRSRSRSGSRSNQPQSPDTADYSKIRANLEELQKSLAKLEMQASEPPSKDEISTVSEVLRVTKDLERSKSTQKHGHQRNHTISEPVAQDSAKHAPAPANASKVRVPSPTRSRSRTLGTVTEFPSGPGVEQASTTTKSTSPPRISNQKRPRDTPSPATSARFSVFPPLATKKPPPYPNI